MANNNNLRPNSQSYVINRMLNNDLANMPNNWKNNYVNQQQPMPTINAFPTYQSANFTDRNFTDTRVKRSDTRRTDINTMPNNIMNYNTVHQFYDRQSINNSRNDTENIIKPHKECKKEQLNQSLYQQNRVFDIQLNRTLAVYDHNPINSRRQKDDLTSDYRIGKNMAIPGTKMSIL